MPEVTQRQQQAMSLVRTAFSAVEALQSQVDSIWGDTERLTEQARRNDVAIALAEGRTRIEGILQDEARGGAGPGVRRD